MEMLPPLVAGVLTGVIRALSLFRREDPNTLRGWRRWFVTYGRVPLTTIGVAFLVALAVIVFGGWSGSYAVRLADLPLLLMGLAIFAIVYAMVGFIFGIPIAAVVCVLIYDVWLWIDGGSKGE